MLRRMHRLRRLRPHVVVAVAAEVQLRKDVAVRLPKAAVRPQALAAQVAGAVAQHLRAEASLAEVVAVVALQQLLLQRNSPMAFT